MATQPAPGWYDDGTGKQRWWDGTHWTDQYIDLREPDIELRSDAGTVGTGHAQAGWYDDQRGRTRWWDGRRWTHDVRYSGQQQEFAGIVIDGRWIHLGDLSQPVSEVTASVATGDALLRDPAFTRTASERRLFSTSGAVTPRTINRVIVRTLPHLVVSGTAQVWAVPFSPGHETAAERFATWVRSSADHYRYR